MSIQIFTSVWLFLTFLVEDVGNFYIDKKKNPSMQNNAPGQNSP